MIGDAHVSSMIDEIALVRPSLKRLTKRLYRSHPGNVDRLGRSVKARLTRGASIRYDVNVSPRLRQIETRFLCEFDLFLINLISCLACLAIFLISVSRKFYIF